MKALEEVKPKLYTEVKVDKYQQQQYSKSILNDNFSHQ